MEAKTRTEDALHAAVQAVRDDLESPATGLEEIAAHLRRVATALASERKIATKCRVIATSLIENAKELRGDADDYAAKMTPPAPSETDARPTLTVERIAS